jgi:predicted transcriptional regulator
MRQTSLLAFRTLDKSKISERQKQVMYALEEIAPANNRQISAQSNLPINVVTPRMNELVQKGLVVEAYRDVDTITGRKSIFWKPKRVEREYGDAY